MEQLFAVRVLVHYYDKSSVDHAAVRRLLSAAGVDSLSLLLIDGTSVSLSAFIRKQITERKPIAEVAGSSGSSLTQVASIFMLAEARAAADALPSSPNELETACSALERLLGCLATKPPLLPVRDIKQSARVKFGTAARRRAMRRISRIGSSANAQEVSILKAVNAVLRLCDVATHCLAVVSRQCVSSKYSCESAVALSTRLLNLASSLHEVQQVDNAPALSFFSSNSLRTALAAGAMHLGAIAVEHLEIEPMTWVHVANRIVLSCTNFVAPRTSVLSALFGGMIMAGKRYESCERDTKAAEGAICMLSTLHVVLETDTVQDHEDDQERVERLRPQTSAFQRHVTGSSSPVPIETGGISQAARSFLGERVVAAEEDGDEGLIATRTVYQACEEYVERAGENDGMMGLLSRLFAAAGRQCRAETADETFVPVSESLLTCQPDDSDASSDGLQVRPESPPFALDVFDQRSKDEYCAGATAGSGSEAGGEQSQRVELHREIGALALDTLAHWVSRAHTLQRYEHQNMTAFSISLCQSASLFSLSKSSASYDLRAAMIDFGSLIGPTVDFEINKGPPGDVRKKWRTLVDSLANSCRNVNPVLKNMLSCNRTSVVVESLLFSFLQRQVEPESTMEHDSGDCSGLRTESLLLLVVSLITETNAIKVVETLTNDMKTRCRKDVMVKPLSQRAATLSVLSFAIWKAAGAGGSDACRMNICSLYDVQSETCRDPLFPPFFPELESGPRSQILNRDVKGRWGSLVTHLSGLSNCLDAWCLTPTDGWRESSLPSVHEMKNSADTDHSKKVTSKQAKLLYHAYWSCILLHEALDALRRVSRLQFDGLSPSDEILDQFPLSSPFMCMKALQSRASNRRAIELLRRREYFSVSALYVAECLALLHPQGGLRTDVCRAFSPEDLPSLLCSLVKNAMHIASTQLLGDVCASFKTFRSNFHSNGNQWTVADKDKGSVRFQFHAGMCTSQSDRALLQVAMCYARNVGTNRLMDLVSDAMASAIVVMSSLTPKQSESVRHLLTDVAQLLLFVPESCARAGVVISRFLETLMALSPTDTNNVGGTILHLARVYGLSKAIDLGSSSIQAMHLCCKFASETNRNCALDTVNAAGEAPDRHSFELSQSLRTTLQVSSLKVVLSNLLMPRDESAVAVSAHAESLTQLIDACKTSRHWRNAVIAGLDSLVCREEAFPQRLVRRSVMESATMNHSILAVFEDVVGTSSSPMSSRILARSFRAACSLYESEEKANLETKLRLLSFVVRLTVAYRRLFRLQKTRVDAEVLEHALLELIVESLRKSTIALVHNPRDYDNRGLVISLCGLLDCFLVGICGKEFSFFERTGPVSSSNARNESKTEGSEDKSKLTVSLELSADASKSASSDSLSTSSLCTYTTTGSQFVEQHWYFCYTCDLAGSEGVCSVCARICHRDCELAYSKFSRFFCDCGAGSDSQPGNPSNPLSASEDGDSGAPQNTRPQSSPPIELRKRKSCKCLKVASRKDLSLGTRDASSECQQPVSGNEERNALVGGHLRDLLLAELRSLKNETTGQSGSQESSLRHAFDKITGTPLAVECLIRSALYLVRTMDGDQSAMFGQVGFSNLLEAPSKFKELQDATSVALSPQAVKLTASVKIFSSGCLDTHAEKTWNGRGTNIAYSCKGKTAAVAAKSGCIDFFDFADVLSHDGGPREIISALFYPRACVAFSIAELQFNAENSNLLLVTGRDRVVILCKLHRGENSIWTHHEIELGLTEFEGSDESNRLLRASWIEGLGSFVLVTTTHFVKVFDVATDTFCPVFFARMPVTQEACVQSPRTHDPDDAQVGEGTHEGPQRKIVAAVAVSQISGCIGDGLFYIILLSTDGQLHVAQSTRSETEVSSFSLLCAVDERTDGHSTSSSVTGLTYHPSRSLLLVSFRDGSLFCASLAFRSDGGEVEVAVMTSNVFREAVTGGPNLTVLPVSAYEVVFMFYHRGHSLKSGGMIRLDTDLSMQVQEFSGSPSAAMTGLSSFSPSPILGEPALGGCFVALDDGSMYRIDITEGRPRPQLPMQTISSTIMERQRLRSSKEGHSSKDHGALFCPVPKTVGFFERCRLVSDQVAMESLEESGSSGMSMDRMTVTLAGGGGECVVSSDCGKSYKFVASIQNRSVVLVGARLRFGGTDRSRNRVPAEVKVFGRVVKWQSQNGLKRWLDIPFTVPESTESPQRALFELVPRVIGEGGSSGDGLVAVDSVELYAVSSIEFTERKLFYENEKAEHLERTSREKASAKLDSCIQYGQISSSKRPVDSVCDSCDFNSEQAALLTVLSAIDGTAFRNEPSSSLLLAEVNGLWSVIFKGYSSRDPAFLNALFKPCRRLCAENVATDGSSDASATAQNLLSKAMQSAAREQIPFFIFFGVMNELQNIEKLLFTVGGLARSLLVSGCAQQHARKELWAQAYDECMPADVALCTLVQAHFALSDAQRDLYNSFHVASMNVVDIAVVQAARWHISGKVRDPKVGTSCFAMAVRGLCSLHQRVRLCTGQRLLELFDCPSDASQLIGSPFETLTAVSMSRMCATANDCENEPATSGTSATDDDSGGAQRWAYRCDSCREVCDEEWWHCDDCEDFDLCSACLRNPTQCGDSTHSEHHVLTRGIGIEEQSDQDGPHECGGVSEISCIIQALLKDLVDCYLSELESEGDNRRCWRFLDGAETITQMLRRDNAQDLRISRTKAFCRSSFVRTMKQTCEVVGEAVAGSVADERAWPKISRGSEALFLMLRMLNSSHGGSGPAFLHKHGITEMLFQFVERMHRKVRSLGRVIGKGRLFVDPSQSNKSLMAWESWNVGVQTFSYDVLQAPLNVKDNRPGGLFRLADEVGYDESLFINLLIVSLELLEHALKSAYSGPVTEQMRIWPRNILCDIINFSESTCPYLQDATLFRKVGDAATRVLSALSLENGKTLNDVLDRYLYEEQSSRLISAVKLDSSFEGFAIEYEVALDFAHILGTLHKAAARHPETWRNYVIENEEVLHSLCKVSTLQGDIQVKALQLLGAGVVPSAEFATRAIKSAAIVRLDEKCRPECQAVAEPSKDAHGAQPSNVVEGSATLSEFMRACDNDSQVSLSIFRAHNYKICDFLVREVMLKSQKQSTRTAASNILITAIARAGKESNDSSLLASLMEFLTTGIKLMPYAGELADGFVQCLRFFILCCYEDRFGARSELLSQNLSTAISSLLKSKCALLVTHPNARLYGRLSDALDVHGYYLESDPCMTCSSTMCEAPGRKNYRMDSIRAETKYTDSSIMHRLLSVHEIFAVSVKVIDPRRRRRVKTITILHSSRAVSDASDLKSPDHPWKKLKSIEIGSSETEAFVDLVVPVAAANIRLDFVDFHSSSDLSAPAASRREDESSASRIGPGGASHRIGSSGAVNDSLQCPRCSRSVTDRHGICRNCHENAYQCRQCRNINYENLDGFLCNECGYCKHGRFEFSISGKPTFVAERIQNEEDRKRASRLIEKETNNVHRCIDQLTKLRSSIIRSLDSGIPAEETKERTRLLGGARTGLADLLDSVAPRSEVAVLEALLEGQTTNDIEETATSQGGISITEEVIAESSGSADPSERDQNNPAGSGLASPMNRMDRTALHEVNIVNRNTNALAATYSRDCRSVYGAMSRSVRILTLTRTELVRYANSVGGCRLQYADDLFRTTEEATANEGPAGYSTLSPANGQTYTACYGCTQAFISNCVSLVQTIVRKRGRAALAILNSDLAKDLLLVCSLCEKTDVCDDIRDLITHLVNDNLHGTQLVCAGLSDKLEFCIKSFETVDSHAVARLEIAILETTSALGDNYWEERLRLVMRLLFMASKHALTCSSVAESIILPCLRVALRLLRADSELTVIGNGFSRLGSAANIASSECPHLQAVERNDMDTSQSGRAVAESSILGMSEVPQTPILQRRSISSSALDSSDIGLLGGVVPDRTATEAAGNPASDEVADRAASVISEGLDRTDMRRQTSRKESADGPCEPQATSTVHAAADSRNAYDGTIGGPLPDMQTMNDLLENCHDSKLLTADVGQWLDGKFNLLSWVSEVQGRSARYENPTTSASFAKAPLRACFKEWRHLSHNSSRANSEGRAGIAARTSHVKKLSIDKENWIVRLMLFTPCITVRKEACSLLKLLCGEEESLQLQFLDILTGPALSLGADVGEKSKEFFDLLEVTSASQRSRLYLIAKGFLPRLGTLIRRRAERLILSEANAESSLRVANFLEGYSLKRLLALLRHTLQAIPLQRVALRQTLFQADNYRLVWSLQRSYVCARKLISLRTRLTDDCGSQICEMLLSPDFLFTGTTISAVVSACVAELETAKLRNDAQAIAILLEQLCLMLCPERKEPVCYMTLNKAPTQEEFIRGSMSRNPYPSSSFDGPLMRDVKNKICKDLDLPGLLEDDFAMELLIAGNVIKLDLPVMSVYEHVWRGSTAASMASSMQPTHITRAFGIRRPAHPSRGTGHGLRLGGNRNAVLTFRRIGAERDSAEEDGRPESRAEPPMVVIYRLSGLDGEATEPIIDSVPTESSEEQDGEELYRHTAVFGEVGGLDLLFNVLAIVGSWGDDAETAVRAPALRLLRASCDVAKNRSLLAKSPDAIKTLLDCAASAFEHAQGNPAAMISADSLLIAAEQILEQQRKEADAGIGATLGAPAAHSSSDVYTRGPEEICSRVRVFLGRLAVATLPKAEDSILHLLPFLVEGVSEAIDIVLEYFRFSWETIDVEEKEQQKARQLGSVLLATPNDSRGDLFAERTISVGIGTKAMEYVVTTFPVPRSDHKEEWEIALESPSPPLMLRIVNGLSLFFGQHERQPRASALMLDIIEKQPRIIAALCQLEMAVSGNAIGTAAEEVLEALGKDERIRKDIDSERRAIKSLRRQAAEASRQAILRETGLNKVTSNSDGTDVHGAGVIATPKDAGMESVLQLMEELPDEVGPSCVVCGDGFRCRPEEALALYVYCRKVPLELPALETPNDGSRPQSQPLSGSRPSSARIDLEFWSSGRSRSSNMQSRSGSSSCYSTVTHMNAIHLSCHKEAARVDRTSRRDEWDGASLRNSQTRCNNLFPVRPPAACAANISLNDPPVCDSARISFSAAVDSYFGRLSSIGRTSLSHAKSVTYDLGRSLLRFADGGTSIFSEYSKGGGPHSNACLIPHLVQMAIYMVEVSPRNDAGTEDVFDGNKSLLTQEATLAKYLYEGEAGDITYYLASSMVLHSLQAWELRAFAFLQRGLEENVLERPTLYRLIAFSDLVHRTLKQNIAIGDQHWLTALRRRIGADEKFPLLFADQVNAEWESHVRSVTDETSLARVIQRNVRRGKDGSIDQADDSPFVGEFLSWSREQAKGSAII